jgi:hypothetical protein
VVGAAGGSLNGTSGANNTNALFNAQVGGVLGQNAVENNSVLFDDIRNAFKGIMERGAKSAREIAPDTPALSGALLGVGNFVDGGLSLVDASAESLAMGIHCAIGSSYCEVAVKNNQERGEILLNTAKSVADGRLKSSLQRWGHNLINGTPEQQREANEQLASFSTALLMGAGSNPVPKVPKAPKVRPPASPVGEKIIPVGESYIPSSPKAVKGTTVTLAQEQRLANGELIPKGSKVTWSDNAVKVVRPDGKKRRFNSRDWEQKALPKPSLSSLANLTSKEQKLIRYLARDNGKIIVNGEQIPVNRLPQDINVKPTPPSPLNDSGRTIGKSKSQNQIMQDDVAYLRSMGAKDIRINQQQVNNQMCRVGICRPDVQATLRDSNKRIYIEYDRASSNRGAGHASRALSNDPDAIVILRTVD